MQKLTDLEPLLQVSSMWGMLPVPRVSQKEKIGPLGLQGDTWQIMSHRTSPALF